MAYPGATILGILSVKVVMSASNYQRKDLVSGKYTQFFIPHGS